MTKPSLTRDFVKMCHEIGALSSLVQGGGGNVSLKVDNNRMLVKGSGLKLRDVTEADGFANVDYQEIKRLLVSDELTEEAFGQAVNKTNSLEAFRPSMETGFHAVLGRCVIHSHSVYANVLNCSLEGLDCVRTLFPDASFVPYVSPGRSLAQKILELSESKYIFLENHGLIVQAQSAEQCLYLHGHVNDKVQEYLNLPRFELVNNHTLPLEFMHDNPLFPDQVVYTSGSLPKKHSDIRQEIVSAYCYIHENITCNGLTPKYLPSEDAFSLLKMEAEKFRMDAIKQ